MSQTHLLSDTIARIKNAQAVRKLSTVVYFSRTIEKVLNLLINAGYIKKIEVLHQRKGVNMIKVYLKYEGRARNVVISDFKVVSKPGRKVFKSYKELDKIYSGLGITVLSTSKGIISDIKAREIRVGGEVLCNIF